ncbi:MAG: hypothetical protein ACJA1E_000069 [Paracoccaceae bacterium]|jgi:hypothetical protein
MVGSIIAAIMTAHIDHKVPKLSIGIMFMPRGTPQTSTPDIRAITNNHIHATMIVAKKPNQDTDRHGKEKERTVMVSSFDTSRFRLPYSVADL